MIESISDGNSLLLVNREKPTNKILNLSTALIPTPGLLLEIDASLGNESVNSFVFLDSLRNLVREFATTEHIVC